MKRIIYAAAMVLAITAYGGDPAAAQVGNAPWCAVISTGTGSVYWDCRYRTVEDCVPNVLAGNRGFCNHNPRWEGPSQPAEPRRHHRKRHVRRY